MACPPQGFIHSVWHHGVRSSARDAGWMFDCQRGGVQVSPATAYPPGYGLMVNVCGPDVPPPVGGLKTVTLADPAVVMSVAGTAAWMCVALT